MYTNNESAKKSRKMQDLNKYFNAIHSNQALIGYVFFEPPAEEDDIPPLMFHSQFSRITLSLYDNTINEKLWLKVNLKADELPYLFDRYYLALQEKQAFLRDRAMSSDVKDASVKQSPAYTVTIPVGTFKGKTPASVLLENPANAEKLKSSRDWLYERINDHANNKNAVAAIDEALSLLNSGNLTNVASASSKSNADADNESPAYTVTMKAGNFAGRTPADVLLSDPSKLAELERHKAWLSERVTAHPYNQQVIDAIDEACYLLSVGDLVAKTNVTNANGTQTNTNLFVLFEERFKVISGGSPDKKIRCEVVISCDFERDNSWSFNIVNSELQAVNGKVDDNSKVLSRKYATIRLNDKEMANFIYSTKTVLRLHEERVAPHAFDFVEVNQWRPGK